MAMSTDLLQLRLSGPFQLTDPAGQRVELASMKSRALLALLASDPDGKRDRRWLESVLWCRAAPANAKASLRQELASLRKALSPHGVTFLASRRDVTLDLRTIDIQPAGNDGIFLADLHVDEIGFRNWLAAQRSGTDAIDPVSPGQKTVRADEAWPIFIARDAQDGPNAWFLQVFGDFIANCLRECMVTPIYFAAPRTDPPARALHVSCSATPLAAGLGIRVELGSAGGGQSIWAGTCEIASSGAPPIQDPKVAQLITRLVAAIRHHLFRLRQDNALSTADALYEQAMRDLFSMNADRVATADALLARAHAQYPRGLYLAARAQIRTIQRVERFSNDIELLEEEAEEFLRKSIEDEPGNSMVLALASNTYGHLMRSADRSLEFAGRSAKINPSNAMAWWALSSSNMYIGNLKSSLNYALRGLNLSRHSQFRFWWEQQAFGAVYALGRHKEALDILKRVHAQNPSYRPPLRYLISLYAHFSMQEDFERAVERLRALEPDFRIEKMINDTSYPASLIHKSPGLDLDALRMQCP